MATPRAKRPRRESSGDLGLSATKPRARQQAKSRQRGEDGGKRVPGPPLEPVTPGRRQLARLRFGGEQGSLVSPSLCPGERGEPLHCGVVPAWGGGQPWAAVLGAPRSPPSQPCYKGAYFSGLPADECQDPAVPSLPPPAPPTPGRRRTRSTPEHTLVLELVRVQLRPHVQQFLESLSKTFEIFIFTTAKQDYAEKILEVLDPKKKLIRRCLSQRDCLCAHGCYWKDLSLLGRDLAKTVALDHTIQGFPSQAANWIPVPRWFGDPGDEELLRLVPLLGQLCRADDVRTEAQQRLPRCRLPTED
ncbi:CTD small phosphatase-like protein 2-A isoform X2 [Oxyura jamaicensis]|uniref:CTD small phosphatase-like protein 2-A isoform X2 n=1 Tax=Oxyura jamaicensis TaxID=8884 RepID=UPI0015A5D156|nr:CTD small phosphatase-like protein 2-A isoform X2 [Oxyura jamaicensis]